MEIGRYFDANERFAPMYISSDDTQDTRVLSIPERINENTGVALCRPFGLLADTAGQAKTLIIALVIVHF